MAERYYAYCVHPDDFERNARGFVLASNQENALIKAKKRVRVERARVAKWLNMTVAQLPALARHYRVRVWRDAKRTTAPITAKHYTEKRRTA